MDIKRNIRNKRSAFVSQKNSQPIKNSSYISGLFTRTLISVIFVLLCAIFVNMSDKNFDNTYIKGTNLENTNAHIHLNKTHNIEGTNLNGCYVYINIDDCQEKKVIDYKDIEDTVFISESKNEEYNHQYMPMALVKKFIKDRKS